MYGGLGVVADDVERRPDMKMVGKRKAFLFLSFRRVLNIICSFLGNSPAPEF